MARPAEIKQFQAGADTIGGQPPRSLRSPSLRWRRLRRAPLERSLCQVPAARSQAQRQPVTASPGRSRGSALLRCELSEPPVLDSNVKSSTCVLPFQRDSVNDLFRHILCGQSTMESNEQSDPHPVASTPVGLAQTVAACSSVPRTRPPETSWSWPGGDDTTLQRWCRSHGLPCGPDIPWTSPIVRLVLGRRVEAVNGFQEFIAMLFTDPFMVVRSTAVRVFHGANLRQNSALNCPLMVLASALSVLPDERSMSG